MSLADKVNGDAEQENSFLSPGPPPRYNKAYADRVRKASETGFTVTEVARLLEVHPDVIQLWSMMYEDFASAMRANIQSMSDRVERALFQRCIGYDYLIKSVTEDDKGKCRRTTTMAHYPADSVAAMNWLRTHDSKRYGPETIKEDSVIVIKGGLPE